MGGGDDVLNAVPAVTTMGPIEFVMGIEKPLPEVVMLAALQW